MPQKVLGPVKLVTKKGVGGTMEMALMVDMGVKYHRSRKYVISKT